LDPERIPVIVGVGQVTHRPRDMAELQEPVELMARAARRAAEDAGGGRALLAQVDTLCVTNILSWGYADPLARAAAAVEASPKTRWYSGVGACAPQWFLGEVADRIAAGRTGVALICGAESYRSKSVAEREGRPVPWKVEGGAPEIVGEKRLPLTEEEARHQLIVPSHVYALFENALRAHRRQTLDEHRDELARFCASMSRVAADNPHAWFPQARTPAEIRDPGPENRMVAFPYTKRMCSMMYVDQAAAVLVTSLEQARRWGVPQGRGGYPRGAGEAADLWFVTHRGRLHESPSVKAAAGMALAQAGLSLEEVDLLDLYSCFPCAPRIVRDALGIATDDPRPLTVTGGLPYFGGPGNNYSLHAICGMVERLREGPGRTGLVQALSWYLHKHAVGVYGSEPPPAGWVRADPGPFLRQLEGLTPPSLNGSPRGRARVETFTVTYRGDEPDLGFVIGRTLRGERFVARVEEDPETLRAMTAREVIGEEGVVGRDPSKGYNLFHL